MELVLVLRRRVWDMVEGRLGIDLVLTGCLCPKVQMITRKPNDLKTIVEHSKLELWILNCLKIKVYRGKLGKKTRTKW